MTFTMEIKDEIARLNEDYITSMVVLSSFVRYAGKIKSNNITLVMENASVARYIFKIFRNIFLFSPKIQVRVQKRFKVKQIYMLMINDRVDEILEKLNIIKDGKVTLPEEYFLGTDDEKQAYIRGMFLACGSISNPQKSGYHAEFLFTRKKDALYAIKLLANFSLDAKFLKRSNKYMIYLKQAEMISDLLKIMGALNSMFYFEDIRIYRDHKNMVNRLNNVDLANQEKVIATGLKQIDDINYLKDNDLVGLLDERIQSVIEYRLKYPEVSFQELADIVSEETGKKISKSGINHYFRKVKDLVQKHKNN